jgi:hypothetical protein
MFVPSLPSSNELAELVFDVEHFKIFGIGGVIGTTSKSYGKQTSWTHKLRDLQPEVGDKVGILKSILLTTFQIECIGFVAAQRGKGQNMVYDIWVTQTDPKEIAVGGFGSFIIEDRTKPIELGLLKGIEVQRVVDIKSSALIYPGFTLTDDQKEELEMLSAKLKTEEKEKRKRKTKENPKRKAKKCSPLRQGK